MAIWKSLGGASSSGVTIATKRERQDHAPAIRAQVLQQAPQQVRVVGFSERFFFVNVAHACSSSSSSNCLRYRSA